MHKNPSYIKWSKILEGSTEEKPIECRTCHQILLKKLQFKNKWLANFEGPTCKKWYKWESCEERKKIDMKRLHENFRRTRQLPKDKFLLF